MLEPCQSQEYDSGDKGEREKKDIHWRKLGVGDGDGWFLFYSSNSKEDYYKERKAEREAESFR